nr:PREDICTED: nucleolar pre-ribosomal-associated protein 1 [Megachile rotundata]
MKINSKSEELQDVTTGVKKKKKDKDKTGDISVDKHVKTTKKNKLKRNLSYTEDEVVKKQKTKDDLNDTNGNDCTTEFDNEMSLESQENSTVKHVKLTTEPEDNKNEENEENRENINEENHYFDVKLLRKSLNSPNNLEMLKKFVKICNENEERDLAAEYLNSGGNILEILRVLDTAEKKNISCIIIVFAVIRILLIKILAQYPQYQSSAEQACHHIVNSHLSSIHSMLSVQGSAKQRRVVLQLLAAVVSLGGTLPCELLVHLSIPPEVIKSVVQHTKPTDKQNIRNCFIHFILAFLIEGNIQIIKVLLEKRDLLSSIFPDLIYDSKEIVNLVLATLKNHVLQNPNITKTMKLRIFSTSIIQNIVNLYNWKGPNNWPKNKVQNFTSNPQYLEEKEVVTEIVHDFLIILLTSHRHGVIFHDRTLGTSHVKHNNLVNTIIQSLDRPWEHEKPSELIIKIMTACPDLIKSQFTILEPYIEPRVSLKWMQSMQFVKKIINSVDVENCIKICSSELNISQLANAIMSIVLPGVLLKHTIIPSLTHSSIIIKHEAILILLTVFQQIKRYLLVIRTKYNQDSDVNTFNKCILESLIKNVPTLNMIMKLWTSVSVPNSVESDNTEHEHIPEPSKHEHLTAVLDLLHIYNEVCPKLLDTLPDIESNVFLNVLKEVNDIGIDEFNALKVKAIQFLVILRPNEFLPQKKIFKNVLSFLIPLLSKETSSISLSVEVTIKTLLNATGMFDGCNDHLDIWIKGFMNLDDKEEVTKWFIHILKKAALNIEKYANEIIEVEENIDEEVVHGGRLEDIFTELVNENNIYENMENIVLRMQRFTSISPLVCCILHKMKTDLHSTILSYLSYVLIHTMHYQVAPQCLIHLVKNAELPVKEYFLSWLEGNDPTYIKEIFPSMNLTCKLNSVLLSNSKLQINEVFNGDNIVTFHYNGEDIIIHHSLSPYDIMHLFKMTVFYLVQFTKRGSLTKIQSDNCKVLLISLLYLAKDSQDNSTLAEKCATFVFTHPVILHNFSPFYQKNKDSIKCILTHMIFDICKVVIHLCKECNIRSLFYHFKNKLITLLCKMIDKRKKSDKINDVNMIITMLELLQLTSQNVVYLLKKLISLESSLFILNDEKNLSLYGYVVPKLLDIATSDEMKSERSVLLELDAEFVKHLCSHLLFLKSHLIINFETWETSLNKYISKFPFNIANIDANMFMALLSTKITDTTVKLISFVISRNVKFVHLFVKYMMKSESIKEGNIILPILASNLNFKWNHNFLQNLKNHYETEILSYLCKPKDTKVWIEENVAAICYLVKHVFDLTACSKTCNSILQIGDKLDMVSIPYIKILQSIYNKCAASDADSEQFIMTWVQVLLHITTLTLKRESKNVKKIHMLCKSLNEAVQHLKNKKDDFVFEALSSSNSWPSFTRFSLKLGLKESNDNEQSHPILKTLSTLCSVAYRNNSDNEHAKTLFEMATTHSAFIDIMLGSSDIKRNLIELLLILIQKNRSTMALTHIPLYLAAYNATLSEADQYILLILQYYEISNINICEYWPYVWGNAAAVHYSVKGEVHMNLWRQPSVTQVLNLFEEDKVNNTIKNYPINRGLKNTELYDVNDIYDPAFYLPLLHYLLSENNVVSCHKVAQSGALALTFAACSSVHADVRMLAYTVIARYYTHLEASSSKAKLWMRLVDALRYGIASLQSELNNVRLNCLVSIFLARTSLVATKPLHSLYPALQTFLLAKPALNINTIPELLQLFHSSDVKHKVHRCWILENIRDGMKTETDLDVAFKCTLFKMLLDFYTCNLSDSDAKILILEVINVTLKIAKASTLLIEGHGLLPWLLGITTDLYKQETRHIELIVEITNKLLNTILSTKGNTNHFKIMLLNVILNLQLHLSKDIKITTFTLYVNILQKLLESKSIKTIVTKDNIIEILELSKKLLGSIDGCDDMMRFGCKYITKTDCSSQDETAIARNSLRTLVWTWCNNE